MDIFLFLAGLIIATVAIILLVIRIFNKKPKKKLLITIAAGFVLFIVGVSIGVSNMTPEEKAEAEAKRIASAQEKKEEKKALEKELAANAEKQEKQKEFDRKKEQEELKEEKQAATDKKEAEEKKKKEQADKEKAIELEKAESKKAQAAEEAELKEKEKQKAEKEAKVAAEAKKTTDENAKKEKQKKERAASKQKANDVVEELVKMGEGAILDIKPTSGDDWIAVNLYVDNSWYLLSEEEKRYTAEQIGPTVESAIIATGATDYCDVYFVDQNGNTVASPKFLGGYKIKK